MLQTAKQAENAAVLTVAQQMCAAIRTAPKTMGKDYLDCCIVTGEELETLAQKMESMSQEYNRPTMVRDANNLRSSTAAVLVGVKNVVHGLDQVCLHCGFSGCKACEEAGGECVFGPIDLGIAVGSAVALAADHRIDNRIMFTAGRAAMELGFLDQAYGCMLCIPLSVSGKSPFFDRG